MAYGQYSGGIGAVVGGIIGGIIFRTPSGVMWGASIGGMVGGIAGQVFWPEKIDINHPLPPKPHENRVQISTYGSSIPIVYESARVAGNIIYMSDVIETVERSRHRQDGVRYYEMVKTYTATFAIAFSEGEVVGLSRIWVNGKIFVDYRDPASPYFPSGDVGLASGNLDTSIARAAAYYSVYLGTEAQVADAALTALLTAAETPTYRGIFYIVFRDFPVGEFSGVPTIEVEIDVPISTDECSEYFNGTDGTNMATDVMQIVTNNGYTPLLYGNSLRFVGTITGEAVRTVFKFTGEFDIHIEFTLETYLGIADGFIYFGLVDATAIIPDNGAHWTDTAISYNWLTSHKYYESSDSVNTTDVTGKMRIVRDSSDDIYVYYWNAALARWEWDGDINGYMMENYSDPVSAQISVYVGDGSTVKIDSFITTSGCSDITV